MSANPSPSRPRRSRKNELIEATLKLVARHGPQAVTVRDITRAAGVTEGALYRHYRSKSDLLTQIYKSLVEDMVAEKRQILNSPEPLPEKIAHWVRVTYAHFDQNPDAFAFVLLTEHDLSAVDRDLVTAQGNIFRQLVASGQASGEIRAMSADLALCHLTGLLLNVPRCIMGGDLPGPASQYTEEVARAALRVLAP